MTSTNGNESRPETPSARLDTFPSKTQAWGETPRYAAEVVQLGLAQRCGITVERRRIPPRKPSSRGSTAYDVVVSRYDGKRPVREARLIREAAGRVQA